MGNKVASALGSLNGDRATSNGKVDKHNHQQISKGDRGANNTEGEDNILLHSEHSFPAHLIDIIILPSPHSSSPPVFFSLSTASPSSSSTPSAGTLCRGAQGTREGAGRGGGQGGIGGPVKEIPVMLTLVEDRVVIRPMEEPGADLSMAVPLLATTYGELTEICWDYAHSAMKLSLIPGGGGGGGGGGGEKQHFILVLRKLMEVEEEIKIRLT
ncbi:Hypothetical protein NocV09_05700010, partial [Nannochloropsis oceanica]